MCFKVHHATIFVTTIVPRVPTNTIDVHSSLCKPPLIQVISSHCHFRTIFVVVQHLVVYKLLSNMGLQLQFILQ